MAKKRAAATQDGQVREDPKAGRVLGRKKGKEKLRSRDTLQALGKDDEERLREEILSPVNMYEDSGVDATHSSKRSNTLSPSDHSSSRLSQLPVRFMKCYLSLHLSICKLQKREVRNRSKSAGIDTRLTEKVSASSSSSPINIPRVPRLRASNQGLVPPAISSAPTSPESLSPRTAAILEAEPEIFAKQVRICSVIKKWIDQHFEDLPTSVIYLLKLFVRGKIMRERNPINMPMANSIVLSITKKVCLDIQFSLLICFKLNGQGSEQAMIFPQLPPEPEVPRNICSPLLSLFDVPPLEIARQLTIIEFSRFRAIKVSYSVRSVIIIYRTTDGRALRSAVVEL
jgi:hypothetical protein